MDLLETILRACDADQHVGKFKAQGIDSYLLKVLVEEDLQELGIEDPETRIRILNHCSTLQIPTEKRRDLTVDTQYLEFTLTHIKVQLNKHLANLSYALHRPEVDLCYIKLGSAAKCLNSCVDCLEEEVLKCEARFVHRKSSKRLSVFVGTIGFTALIMFAGAKYWKVH